MTQKGPLSLTLDPDPGHDLKETREVESDSHLMGLLRGLSENTNMHGLPNVYRSRSHLKKAFWATILLAGIAFLTWQIVEAFIKYYKYPTETTIDDYVETKLPFPAVTICNLNPILRSALSKSSQNFDSFSDDVASPTSDPLSNGSRTFINWDDLEPTDPEADDPGFQVEESFLYLYSLLTREERIKYGHPLADMLLSCSFMGKPCTPRNFLAFADNRYGSCYTFNSGFNNSAVRVARKSGPQYALVMTLYINQTEYISDITQSAGMRVVIHNQTYMPFPQDQGFSISPGMETFVGMKRREEKKSPPPYGPCQTVSGLNVARKNTWAGIIPDWDIGYTSQACQLTCYQKNVLSRCKCADLSYPSQGFAFNGIPEIDDLGNCDPANVTQASCKAGVQNRYSDDELGCRQECPPRCFTVKHELSISQARWPADVHEVDIIETLRSRSPWVDDYLQDNTRTAQSNFIRANVLKLRIYFKDLEFTSITTSPSFLVDSLLSAVGGQCGFWIGLSIVTLFEFVELLADFINVCYVRIKLRQRTKPGPA